MADLGWVPFAAYLLVGAVSNGMLVHSWRKADDWYRHWSDWMFVGFVPGLVLWPFILPYQIRDRVCARRESSQRGADHA